MLIRFKGFICAYRKDNQPLPLTSKAHAVTLSQKEKIAPIIYGDRALMVRHVLRYRPIFERCDGFHAVRERCYVSDATVCAGLAVPASRDNEGVSFIVSTPACFYDTVILRSLRPLRFCRPCGASYMSPSISSDA